MDRFVQAIATSSEGEIAARYLEFIARKDQQWKLLHKLRRRSVDMLPESAERLAIVIAKHGSEIQQVDAIVQPRGLAAFVIRELISRVEAARRYDVALKVLGAFDGVFVWNCFEQVPEPRPLLREIRRVARPGALVVVRTPNAFFYEICESMLGASEFALKAMAYNNLLGFPYLYGYSSRTLNQLVASEGFEVEGMLNSELITLPLPEMPDWVAEESAAVSAAIRKMNEAAPQGLLTGPWIELYYRVTATPL